MTRQNIKATPVTLIMHVTRRLNVVVLASVLVLVIVLERVRVVVVVVVDLAEEADRVCGVQVLHPSRIIDRKASLPLSRGRLASTSGCRQRSCTHHL